MTIVFQNPGLIDLRAVQIMGLNAKESKNPIGQFGTGLKYAIAVLLRSNCQIKIFQGENEFYFTTRKEDFRGKSFQFVFMRQGEGSKAIFSEKPLGFTLELGKHWEPWMAIRELESNARDEGGRSFIDEDYQLSPDTTTIVISGVAAESAYSKLRDIFINTKPLWKNGELEVHPLQNPEQAFWMHYRGVRARKLEKPSLYRYNLIGEQALTEDRTFRYSWAGDGEMVNLGLLKDHDMIRNVVTADKSNYESDITFSEYAISDQFAEVVGALGNRANVKAWKAVRIAKGHSEFTEVPMDGIQQKMLARAQDFIEKMGETRIRTFPVYLTPDLGANALGRAMIARKEIWLSLRVFEMGMKQLVSCLYEEYIHLDRKYSDLDREMQNFLFDTIITQAAKLQGEIL